MLIILHVIIYSERYGHLIPTVQDFMPFNSHYILWHMSMILFCGIEWRSDSGSRRMKGYSSRSPCTINETSSPCDINTLLKLLTPVNTL